MVSLISNTNNSIYYQSFVYTQFNAFKCCYVSLTIQLNISHLFTHSTTGWSHNQNYSMTVKFSIAPKVIICQLNWVESWYFLAILRIIIWMLHNLWTIDFNNLLMNIISLCHEYYKLATIVEGDPKAPFSIATTPRCRGGRYSIPRIAPLYPWTVPYNAEC